MSIIYRGKPYDLPRDLQVPIDVRKGLWFERPLLKKDPTSFIIHHTAGEGDHLALFHVLEHRNASVQFGMDAAGFIIQYADLAARCGQAKGANAWSVGIEIANAGTVNPKRPSKRESYADSYCGRPVQYLRYYPVQVDYAYRLTRAVCHILKLPFVIPTEPDNENRALRSYMSADGLAARAHRGVLGHLHIGDAVFPHANPRRKLDPSPHILDEFIERAKNDGIWGRVP